MTVQKDEPCSNTTVVQRLRAVAEFGGTHLDGLWTEAADKIERLRDGLAELLEAIDTGEVSPNPRRSGSELVTILRNSDAVKFARKALTDAE